MRIAYVSIMSNKSHSLYIGSTTDLETRAKQHKSRHCPNAFTARYNFDRLVWFEIVSDVEEARAREKKMKKWPRARKVAAIQEKNPNWLDLTTRLHWSASLG